MDIATIRMIGLILLLVIALGYVRLFFFVNRRLKKDSRVAQFKVGGRKFGELHEKEETREDRVKKRQVSLRDGPMFRRRLR